MKIGDLRRSQFMNYDCMWNGLVRDVTAQLEQSEDAHAAYCQAAALHFGEFARFE